MLNYSVLGGLPIIFLHPAVSHVFHVQVQRLGPGFRSSRLITVPLLYEYISWLHIHFHPGVKQRRHINNYFVRLLKRDAISLLEKSIT